MRQETDTFKLRMKGNDDDIQEEFSKLDDDKLLVLEEEGVKRVWDNVSAQFPVRNSWIESLSQALYAIENDRQAVMRDTLAQVRHQAPTTSIAAQTPFQKQSSTGPLTPLPDRAPRFVRLSLLTSSPLSTRGLQPAIPLAK